MKLKGQAINVQAIANTTYLSKVSACSYDSLAVLWSSKCVSVTIYGKNLLLHEDKTIHCKMTVY